MLGLVHMFMQEPTKAAIPGRTQSSVLLKRWGIGLLVVCLLAIGAYVFFTKSGEAQPRPAKGSLGRARAVPVVAVAAKRGDIGVYLTGLGSVTPLKTVTVRSRVDGERIAGLHREGPIVRSGDRFG